VDIHRQSEHPVVEMVAEVAVEEDSAGDEEDSEDVVVVVEEVVEEEEVEVEAEEEEEAEAEVTVEVEVTDMAAGIDTAEEETENVIMEGDEKIMLPDLVGEIVGEILDMVAVVEDEEVVAETVVVMAEGVRQGHIMIEVMEVMEEVKEVAEADMVATKVEGVDMNNMQHHHRTADMAANLHPEDMNNLLEMMVMAHLQREINMDNNNHNKIINNKCNQLMEGKEGMVNNLI